MTSALRIGWPLGYTGLLGFLKGECRSEAAAVTGPHATRRQRNHETPQSQRVAAWPALARAATSMSHPVRTYESHTNLAQPSQTARNDAQRAQSLSGSEKRVRPLDRGRRNRSSTLEGCCSIHLSYGRNVRVRINLRVSLLPDNSE